MKEKKDIKLKIFETALEIYCENPTQFSVRTVAKELNLKREEVYTYFPSKNAILRYFYHLCLINRKKTSRFYYFFGSPSNSSIYSPNSPTSLKFVYTEANLI